MVDGIVRDSSAGEDRVTEVRPGNDARRDPPTVLVDSDEVAVSSIFPVRVT